MTQSPEDINSINKLIHEPARMSIMAVLSAVDQADFKYLMTSTNLTKGNLSLHLSKLEDASYIEIIKSFIGKTPNTNVRLTRLGRTEFNNYIRQMRKLMKNL
ncbi:MAG TPA: transcriptional regulator [bacterium]